MMSIGNTIGAMSSRSKCVLLATYEAAMAASALANNSSQTSSIYKVAWLSAAFFVPLLAKAIADNFHNHAHAREQVFENCNSSIAEFLDPESIRCLSLTSRRNYNRFMTVPFGKYRSLGDKVLERFVHQAYTSSNPDRSFEPCYQAFSNADQLIHRLPILDIAGRKGPTGYIDFIQTIDMIAPVMRFKDDQGRLGLALRIRQIDPNQETVLTLFQRQGGFINIWSNAVVKGNIEARHDQNDHEGPHFVECPKCPISAFHVDPQLLYNILTGQDPDFTLGGRRHLDENRSPLSFSFN